MLYHADDIPALKERLADAIGRRAVVVNRIAELRPLIDPIERRCRSIRLATWANLYDREPPEEGQWDLGDACNSVSEAVALIDAVRFPYTAELVELKDLRGEEKTLSAEVDRLQKDLESIANRQAKSRKKTSPKKTEGSLL